MVLSLKRDVNFLDDDKTGAGANEFRKSLTDCARFFKNQVLKHLLNSRKCNLSPSISWRLVDARLSEKHGEWLRASMFQASKGDWERILEVPYRLQANF